LKLEPEHVFQPHAIGPTTRTRIPGPPATTHLPSKPLDIRGDYIRFAFVAFDFFHRPGSLHGIDHFQQFYGPCSLLQASESLRKPQSSMGILSAIFTDSWRVTHDVTRMLSGMIEGWIEEENQLVCIENKLSFGGTHCRGCSFRTRCLREHRPGLG